MNQPASLTGKSNNVTYAKKLIMVYWYGDLHQIICIKSSTKIFCNLALLFNLLKILLLGFNKQLLKNTKYSISVHNKNCWFKKYSY